jgi:hypothetical protein
VLLWRRQNPKPKLDWADRALFAALVRLKRCWSDTGDWSAGGGPIPRQVTGRAGYCRWPGKSRQRSAGIPANSPCLPRRDEGCGYAIQNWTL